MSALAAREVDGESVPIRGDEPVFAAHVNRLVLVNAQLNIQLKGVPGLVEDGNDRALTR